MDKKYNPEMADVYNEDGSIKTDNDGNPAQKKTGRGKAFGTAWDKLGDSTNSFSPFAKSKESGDSTSDSSNDNHDHKSNSEVKNNGTHDNSFDKKDSSIMPDKGKGVNIKPGTPLKMAAATLGAFALASEAEPVIPKPDKIGFLEVPFTKKC